MLKGFVLGYRHAAEHDFHYFFNRRSGIRSETFGEHIMQLFEMDQYTHLCVDKSHVDDFIQALEEVKEFGVELVERSEIDLAEFSIEVFVYNRHLSGECEKIIKFREESVRLSNAEAEEIFDESGNPKAHAYTYHLVTDVSGPFDKVMDFYLSLKKSPFVDFIEFSEIELRTLDAIRS
jgi:hypothetical protein